MRLKRPELPDWNYWAALPLLALIMAAALGFLLSSHAPANPGCDGTEQGICRAAIDNNPTVFLEVGRFFGIHHNAVEALAAFIAAVAAVGLFFVTAGLWRATGRLATSTEDLAVAATAQSAEMSKASGLAEKQFSLAADEHNLAAKQHGLQRLQFLAEHGPKIQIRSIGLRPSGSGGQMFHTGMRVEGSLVIVNASDGEATISDAEYRIYWSRTGLPMVVPLALGRGKPLFADLPHRMEGHESCLVVIEADDVLDGEAAHSILQSGAWHLYIMGAIQYRDWDLKERWMGFCRVYKRPDMTGGEGRFVPVDNTDYEYSD